MECFSSRAGLLHRRCSNASNMAREWGRVADRLDDGTSPKAPRTTDSRGLVVMITDTIPKRRHDRVRCPRERPTRTRFPCFPRALA